MKSRLNQNCFRTETPQQQSHEFYSIPLLGQMRLDHSFAASGAYNIGEIINNIKQDDAQTVSLQAMDDGLASIGILKGDFLNVTLKKPLKNNDIAAVILGSRLYVRKIFFERGFIRLDTAAEKSTPLIIEPKTPGFKIIGKVTSVIREL